jgi:hypothetical protein
MSTPDQKPDEHQTASSPYAGLPTFESYLSANGENSHRFECAGCNSHSPLVQSYSLPTVMLLPFVAFWRMDVIMKCPGCMRAHILCRLPLAVLLSNIISPIIVVFWLVAFGRTFFSRPS